ncbi:Mom family adenine methylcarbamoylation protein [Caballeronia sp. EK]|uniref:Mom family adenine methylcarbamoylation protein n=1 Tax=Caballeronia sp. EK TaxID=2767469 RepID=UPI001CA42268|nr:protein Mom [Caballeronia sp. EK]
MSMPARQSEALGAKPALRIDWATGEAVAYACGHWHYSRSVPVSTNVKIGAWEDDRFIGIVLFSRGANRHIGNPYGLTQTECCELSRVALRDHCAPVSRIVMLAVKFLRRASPGLRLIVSYADTVQGHVGGIYQAMGWIYTGVGKTSRVVVHGEVLHGKTASSRYGKQGFNLKWLVANVDPKATRIDGGDKHRYLLPLDNAMRAQVAPLAKPYPKLSTPREKQAMTGPTGTAAAQHRPSRSILQTVTHARHAKRSRNRT